MTDLTPCAEAVEAACRAAWDNRDGWSDEMAKAILTAAMPALTAQIRAATVKELVDRLESLKDSHKYDMGLDVFSGFLEGLSDAQNEARALLPAPTPATEE